MKTLIKQLTSKNRLYGLYAKTYKRAFKYYILHEYKDNPDTIQMGSSGSIQYYVKYVIDESEKQCVNIIFLNQPMWSTDKEYQRFIIEILTELTDSKNLRVYYQLLDLNDPIKYPDKSSKSPEGVQFHIASSETQAEEIKQIDLLHPGSNKTVLVMEQTLTFSANYTDEMSHNKTLEQFIKEFGKTILSTPILRHRVNLLTITIKAF